MPSSIQGPDRFLTPFLPDQPPYDLLTSIGAWAASPDYCDEQKELLAEHQLGRADLQASGRFWCRLKGRAPARNRTGCPRTVALTSQSVYSNSFTILSGNMP